MELTQLGVSEVRELIAKGEITAREVVEAYASRIEALEPKVRAFVTATLDSARERAGSEGLAALPLGGVPLALKDNLCTVGAPTTCSSRILEGYVPPYESTATRLLSEAGAISLGKTNLDEFAMGSSTENSGFHRTHNPWDLERVPGGSSGGSAAAVAADFCAAALGSDTGGSIRQPAAFCGVVGLKPTYGRVSRYGLVAFASSLDQIGPITKNVRDAALVLNAISGHDRMDSTSAPVEVPDFTANLGTGIKGMKIGVPKEFFIEGLDPEVEKLTREAFGKLEELGAEIVDISLPHTGYSVASYYVLATSEASSNLARYDGVKYGLRAGGGKDLLDMYGRTRAEGFGAEVQRRIMVGTHALSSGYYDAYYRKAQQVRTLISRDFESAFEKVDLIATPTTPEPAFEAGAKTADPLKMYLSDIFTISVNLAGLPAISVPSGFTGGGLPAGLQLIGRAFDEESVLRAANAYEEAARGAEPRRRPVL